MAKDMNAPITIASFYDDTTAHIYLALLGHNGIEAVIQDGNTVNVNWFYTIAVAGAKLQVRRKDSKPCQIPSRES